GATPARGGIWSGHDSTDVRPIVLEGDAYPGIADAHYAYIANAPQVGPGGNIAFSASVIKAGGQVFSGVWMAARGGLQTLLRSDLDTPNIPGHDYEFNYTSNAIVNGSGAVGFAGLLKHPPSGDVNDRNDYGIWRRDADGAVTLVAREGDLFPGADSNE